MWSLGAAAFISVMFSSSSTGKWQVSGFHAFKMNGIRLLTDHIVCVRASLDGHSAHPPLGSWEGAAVKVPAELLFEHLCLILWSLHPGVIVGHVTAGQSCPWASPLQCLHQGAVPSGSWFGSHQCPLLPIHTPAPHTGPG